jgi:hypothetical protein
MVLFFLLLPMFMFYYLNWFLVLKFLYSNPIFLLNSQVREQLVPILRDYNMKPQVILFLSE